LAGAGAPDADAPDAADVPPPGGALDAGLPDFDELQDASISVTAAAVAAMEYRFIPDITHPTRKRFTSRRQSRERSLTRRVVSYRDHSTAK
jgi:hypothetical protein